MAGQCLLLGTIISVTFFISVRFLLSTVLTEVPISFVQIWILTVACCSELLNCKIKFFWFWIMGISCVNENVPKRSLILHFLL